MAFLTLAVLAMLSPACKRESAKSKTDRAPSKRLSTEEVTKNVSALTGNAHVRLAWIEQGTRRGFDPFGEQDNYRLVTFDNRGGGFRVLGTERNNYSRPLLTPDGSNVIFTERQGLEKKRVPKRGRVQAAPSAVEKTAETESHRDSLIKLIPWSGGRAKVLAKGLAVSTWRDPASGEDWVYFVEDQPRDSVRRGTSQTVHRFPLKEPERSEAVWRGTPLNMDNFHISRDGRVFAALFPWPEAGVGDFTAHDWRKLELGCWPALAPDNSRLAWVFDGGHKRLRLFDASLRRFAELDLREAPGMGRHAGFHPRWSNHPRFIVMTGPYISNEKKGRDALAAGAGHAEIYLGKLKADCTAVERWIRITANRAGDFFPDAWIEGGDKAVLESFPQHTNEATPTRLAPTWPVSLSGLQFAWSDAKADNKIAAGGRSSSLTARGRARNGRHFDLLLDGGWFEPDADSTAAWIEAVNKSKTFFLQVMLTEEGDGPLPTEGVSLLACETETAPAALALKRVPQGFHIEVLTKAEGRQAVLWRDQLVTGALTSKRPVALALVWNNRHVDWFIDGNLVRTSENAPAELNLPQGTQIKIGSANASWPARSWRAEKVILGSEAPGAVAVAADAKAAATAASGRAPLTPSHIIARVIKATQPDPERLDVYKRMLVDHTYEVLRTVRGPKVSATRFAVLHWAILDEESVPGIPRQPGAEVELLIEPAERHPEIESELTITGESDFSLPLFYDIEPANAR